jgi:transposase InsO family protein
VKGVGIVLVELGLVEQRYRAVLEVLDDGASVTDVARRYGVVRQTVHTWLRRYATAGLAGLADGSSRPVCCPHQMSAEVEALIVEWRRVHPGWGPRTIVNRLAREGVDPLPGRSSVYRALVRHGLIDPKRRRRRRSDYKRWERARAMELWQMDITGGVHLVDGSEVSVVTGVDDYSRFCVSAKVVARATARPVCDALAEAMRTHGVPEAILSDNGKVFTGRFGPGVGEVLFDRICGENGIRHLLTAPHSPTTTGKVERFHKTMKREFLDGKVFDSIADAQAALDGWVAEYNHEREHQSLGDRPPIERFRLARTELLKPVELDAAAEPAAEPVIPARRVTRVVDVSGRISLGGFRYHAGRWLALEAVEVVSRDGLIELFHDGVLIATHVRRHLPEREPAVLRRQGRRPRLPSRSSPVTRKVDSSGSVSFAGASYRAGNSYRRRQVEVSVVGDTVQIAFEGRLVRTHAIRHDRTKEHGAFANPGGRPRRINAA